MVQTNVNPKVILTKKVKKSQKKKKLPKNPSTITNFERKKEDNPVNNVRIKTQILVAPYFSKCVVYIIYYTHYYNQKTHTKIEIGWYRMAKLFLDSVTATKGVDPAQNNPYSLLTRSFIRSIGKNIGPNSYKSVLVQYVTLSTLATLPLAITITMTIIDSMRKNTGIFAKHGKNGKSGIKGAIGNKSNKHGNGNSHDIAIYHQIYTLEIVLIEAKLVVVTKIVTHFTSMMLLTPKVTKNKLHDVVMANKLGKRLTPAPAVQTVPTRMWSSLSRSAMWLKGRGEQVKAPDPQLHSSRQPWDRPPGPPELRVLDLDAGDLAGRVGDLEGEQVSDLRFPDLELGGLEVGDPGRQELEVRTESEARPGKTESEADRDPEADIQLKKKKMRQMGKSPDKITNKLNQLKQPSITPNRITTATKPILPLPLPTKYLTQEWVFLPWRFGEGAPNQVESAIKVKEREDRPLKFITQITPSLPLMVCSVSRHMGYSIWPRLKRPKR